MGGGRGEGGVEKGYGKYIYILNVNINIILRANV